MPENGLRITASGDGCTLAVRVHPGARRNEITGIYDGALKISLTAPPAGGKANAALLRFLAAKLGIARSRVELVSGATNRAKVIQIAGLSTVEVQAKLSAG